MYKEHVEQETSHEQDQIILQNKVRVLENISKIVCWIRGMCTCVPGVPAGAHSPGVWCVHWGHFSLKEESFSQPAGWPHDLAVPPLRYTSSSPLLPTSYTQCINKQTGDLFLNGQFLTTLNIHVSPQSEASLQIKPNVFWLITLSHDKTFLPWWDRSHSG